MSTERRPNLFLAGAQKSGTSALAAMLGRHPQVFMSFPKEPGYLAFGAKGYCLVDGYGRPAPARQYVVRDHNAYLGLFAGVTKQTVLGEASTWYFAIPGMAERIDNYNSAARVIVILRNPVDRAYSAWGHARRDGLEPCDSFTQALQMESERGNVEFLLRYRQMGLYAGALREYQRVFPPSRLLVLFYDDLVDHPADLWHNLCAFLQIDTALPTPQPGTYNRSGIPRSRIVQSLLKSYRFKAFFRALLPRSTAISIKQRVDRANLRQFPPMADATRRELQNYFRNDIHALMRATGRDLSNWLDQGPSE